MAARRTSAQRVRSRGAARAISGSRTIPDTSVTFVPARGWLAPAGNTRSNAAESNAEALVKLNRGLLRDFRISARPAVRGDEPGVEFTTSGRIGAVPLLSPVTGRPDFGLVIEPRFTWSSAGDMLHGTGFKVVPEILPLPNPPQSERRVPAWVLSSVVLIRLQALLKDIQRRFVYTELDAHAPKGAVDWGRYARTRFAVGRPLQVPVRYPDLQEDSELRAGIAWVVRRHREVLLAEPGGGLAVRKLLILCAELESKLGGVTPKLPSHSATARWQRLPISRQVFRDGIEAIGWTVDERGLGGLADLAGLAWRMDMEVFFEAWVEAIAAQAAKTCGATVSSGRLGQTRVPLSWNPPSSGSQRSLIPDIVISRGDTTMVVDAKYKRHAEEIERLGWGNVGPELREQHRDDVLQALAYSTLFETKRTIACLAYPVAVDRWRQLEARGRALMRARVHAQGGREIEVAVVAVPLNGEVASSAGSLERCLRFAA